MKSDQYGPVYDAAVPKEKSYGFVHMLTSTSAEDAVHSLNGISFKGQNITVTFSFKRGMNTSTTRESRFDGMITMSVYT